MIIIILVIENNYNIYNKIDIIYYINLDNRVDRNIDFLNEIKKINFPQNKIKRISAIYNDTFGGIGCSKSHIKTLKEFIQSSHNICIIFEDDFEFLINEKEFKNYLYNISKNLIDFDIICLSGNIINTTDTIYNFIKKVNNVQTTSGYMITKKFAINYLLENFIIGSYLLETGINNKISNAYELYAIDQYWKLLQLNSKWYIFYPKIGKQRESFSDILKTNVNYQT